MEDKKYFDVRIGSLHFILDKYVLYTYMSTKHHYMYRFYIMTCSETDDDYDERYWLTVYTGPSHAQFVYGTGSRDDTRHRLSVSLGYGNMYLYFPWRNHNVEREDPNDPHPEYGFRFYGERWIPDTVFVSNRKGRMKGHELPWSPKFYRQSWLFSDKSWHTILESDRNGVSGIKAFMFPYYVEDDDERLLVKEFPFRYVLGTGEVQETTARCFMEEREWRPKWLSWTGLFSTIHTSLNIRFSGEMGGRRGSWKGGVIGVDCRVTEEERQNMDFETPLRRYENEINKTHGYDR